MLQVSSSQLAAFDKEARATSEQQLTPKERFGLYKKKQKRKLEAENRARREDVASLGNVSSRSTKKSGKSKKSRKSKKSGKSGRSKASAASRRGDPSLPGSLAGRMQVALAKFD